MSDYCPHCGRGGFRPHIPDSPGLRRPKHMDDEEWAEYRFSEEARVELTHVPEDDSYSFYDDYPDAADAHGEEMAEIEEEGRSAAKAGCDPEDNPYGEGERSDAWADGFFNGA